MNVMSIGARAASAALVTRDPDRAGLATVSVRDVARGRARGIVCGGGPQSGRLLMLPPGLHATLVGRTGSGKTRGVLEPTVLANAIGGARTQPNMLVVDAKGTIRRETEDLVRAEGYRVRVIDLASSDSPDLWNPLTDMHDAMRADDQEAAERALSRIEGPLRASVASRDDRYWENAGWSAIAGFSMGLSLHTPEREPTLADVSRWICDADLVERLAYSLGGRAPAGVLALRQLTEAPRTFACVQNIVSTMLAFYGSDIGRRVSSSSTVDVVRDLFDERPTIYYLVIPDTTSASDAYASLFIDYLYQSYCAEHDRRALERQGARPLMILLDEFARLPRIPQIAAAMSAGRSRDVRVLITLQSVSQLVEKGCYSPAEAQVMLEQAAASIYLGCTSPEVARDASLKSGGVVGMRELMLLERGEAYVTLAGSPTIKTRCEPFTHHRAALARARKEGRHEGR